MGFFDTFINLFRLSSPNARIYTFWGLTSVLLGSLIASYWWPTYSFEGKRKLGFMRKKQIQGETEKTTVKIIPSPSVAAPAPTSATAKTSSTTTTTTSNNISGAPSHAASTPSVREVPKELPKELPQELPKKETPAAGGKLKHVPPTPPPTPADSPYLAPKASITTSSTTVSVPPTTVVKDTPKTHAETKTASTLKQTITEIEVKEEVPVLNNNKFSVLETEPEEKTKKRDAVIQEVYHPIQVEEIQPVVHRERLQKEVHQVIQPFHEEIIKAPKVIEREALPEHRAAEWEDSDEYKQRFEEGFKTVAAEQTFEDVQNVTIYNEPIIEEVVKKEIINVIQPVIKREIVEPTIIKTRQPIYEEVHEEPILVHEELEVKELGRRVEGLEHEKKQYFEVKKKIHTELDTEIKTTVEKKGTETKIISNTIQTK